MRKWMLCTSLLVAAFIAHVPTASAQRYYGWSPVVNAAAAERAGGPTMGLCLDVPRSSRTPGTEVILHACHGHDNQQFRLKDNSLDSRIAVYQGADERCLTYGPRDGWTKVFIEQCDRAKRWVVHPESISVRDDPFTCMTAHPVYGFLIVEHCTSTDSTRFGQTWSMSVWLPKIGSAGPIVSDASGECIDVRYGSTSPGASLIHYGCSGAAWQTFQLYKWYAEDDMVMIGVYAGGEMRCISNVPPGAGGATEAVTCNPGDPRQVFRAEGPVKRGMTTTLVNWMTGLCLDAYAHSAWVGSWSCHGGRNQKWRL